MEIYNKASKAKEDEGLPIVAVPISSGMRIRRVSSEGELRAVIGSACVTRVYDWMLTDPLFQPMLEKESLPSPTQPDFFIQMRGLAEWIPKNKPGIQFARDVLINSSQQLALAMEADCKEIR